MNNAMNRTTMNRTKGALIWDLPIRLFHWLFAGGFIAAAAIAKILGDDSPLFPYHSLLGLVLALMVALRLIWGVVGTRYARFSSFAFGPRAVLEYFIGVLTGNGRRHIGHNPGSAWAIYVMLLLVLGLAVTGVLMGQGNENVKDIHELLAHAMIVVVVLHVLGVAIHTIRHRENIVAAMIHGRKATEGYAGIGSNHVAAALIFLFVCGLWGFGLWTKYDPAQQTTKLPLLGITVQLGEEEEQGHDGRHDDGYEEHK